MNQCKERHSPFQITDQDKAFRDRMSTVTNEQKHKIPQPTKCPDCRMQQRVAFRNEMNFHKAKCDLTGKSILTNIMPGRGFKIYDSEAWHSDKWDPLDYGRDYDFNRPFFEQFQELMKAVPHANLANGNSENSDYCNHAAYAKDCYLTARIGHSEKIYYSYLPIKSFRCFDCYFIQSTQESYEAIDCNNCYQVFYSQQLDSCQNVYFSFDCSNCQDCFGCYGLKNKQYHFFNQAYSKQDYEKLIGQFNLGSHAFIQKMKNQFYQKEILKFGLRHAVIKNSENTLGNFIHNSQNVDHGFDVSDSQDIAYGWGVQTSKDNHDVYAMYYAEEAYNTVSCFESQRIKFCYLAYKGCYDLEYCMECFNNTKHCFGCVGLTHKEFCILNRQYSESEFYDLRGKIIEQMRASGEYGEYFPISLSPYAYNESVAQEYFPLSQAEVEKRGGHFFEREASESSDNDLIPDDIKEVKDDILEAVLICEVSGRPYKIIPQELEFLRKHNLPIPRRSYYQRHIDRIALRLPRKLWERECGKCGKGIRTSYSPGRSERVYCELCYLKSVY